MVAFLKVSFQQLSFTQVVAFTGENDKASSTLKGCWFLRVAVTVNESCSLIDVVLFLGENFREFWGVRGKETGSKTCFVG